MPISVYADELSAMESSTTEAGMIAADPAEKVADTTIAPVVSEEIGIDGQIAPSTEVASSTSEFPPLLAQPPADPETTLDTNLEITASSTASVTATTTDLLMETATTSAPKEPVPANLIASTTTYLSINKDSYAVKMPADLSSPIVLNNLEMRLLEVSSSSTFLIDGDSVIYQEALASTDIKYEIKEDSLKESIILKGTGHPGGFRYQVNFDAYDYKQVSDNEIVLYKKGRGENDLFKLYTLTTPSMTDAAGNTSTKVKFQLEGNILTVVPDETWLSNATYPVVVDPTIEINVLNVHSHPVEGEYWNVDFTTVGTGDLYVAPADQATIDDMQFASLKCGSEDRTAGAQILAGDVVYYPDWSCDEVATVSHLDLKTGDHHLLFTFQGVNANAAETGEVATAEAFNSALIWKGTTGDGKYSTAGNWSTNKVPSAADTITLDNTCTSCNMTIDVSTTTASFTVASTYTGTITQAAGTAFTVTGAFSQAAGTYNGGTGTTTFQSNFTTSGTAVFNSATTTVFSGSAAATINTNGTLAFYDLKFTNSSVNGTRTLTSTNVMVVNGTLTFGGSGAISGGNLQAKGNILQIGSSVSGGSTVVDFANDSLAQTFSVNSTGESPVIRFDSAADASDSVVLNTDASFAGATTTSAFSGILPFSNPSTYSLTFDGSYSQAAGTFNGGTGTTTFAGQPGSFTLSGTAVYNAASTTQFGAALFSTETLTFIGGTQTFYNVRFIANGSVVIGSGNTMVVNGTLYFSTINGSVDTGTIQAKGNIVNNSSNTSSGGSVIIDFANDAVAQTLTMATTGYLPVLRLDSAADASDSIVLNTNSFFQGVTTTASFSGAIPISNPSNYDITFGTSGYLQAAGTFNGGIGTTTFFGNFTTSGTAVFNPATTTVFRGGLKTLTFLNNTQSFYNVQFNFIDTFTDTITSGNVMVVNGALTLTDGGMNTGTINTKGDIVQAATYDGGTAVLDFGNDSVSQTFTVNGGTGQVLRFDSIADASDNVVINAAAGFNGATTTSSFSGTIPISNPSRFALTMGSSGYAQAAGTFNLGNTVFADNGNFTISGGLFNGGTATTTFGGNFTTSGTGVFNAASTTVFNSFSRTLTFAGNTQTFNDVQFNLSSNGSDTITSGNTMAVRGTLFFTDGFVNSGTMSVQGNVIVASTYDGGTTALVFSGSADQNFDLTGATSVYNGDITINKSGGEVTLLSGLTLDAASQDLIIQSGTLDINGYNLTATGTSGTLIVQSGGNLQLQGGETITANTNYPQLQAGSTVTYDGGGSYALKSYSYSNLTLSGTGTFTAPAGTLNIGGTFSHLAGTFNANGGTVALTGTNQAIFGNTTFYNLTKTAAAADTLTFANGSIQTVTGTLTLQGVAGQLLSLRSNSGGTQWQIDPQAARTIGFLDVQDSKNINRTAIAAGGTGSINSGNNTMWDFGETFDQKDFRFYRNTDTLTPTTPRASQGNFLRLRFLTDPLARLRLNVLVSTVDLAALSRSFVLQVSNLLTGGWDNVGATSTISFHDNPSVSSGTTLPTALLTSSTVSGTYQEIATSSPNPIAAAIGSLIEFDFSLNVSNIVAGLTYYFRLITDDSAPLDAYTNYASLIYTSNIAPSAPSALGPSGLIDGSWTSDNTPTLQFTLSDPEDDQVRFHILIDDDSDFSSPAVDYTSPLQTAGAASFTPAALPDGSYYWRVSASDEYGASSATTTANAGGIAFKIETVKPDPGILAGAVTIYNASISLSGASDSGSGLAAAPYIFYNATLGTDSGEQTSTTWAESGLTPNTTYTYYAIVTDTAGNSSTSPPIMVTTDPVPQDNNSSGSSSGRGDNSFGGSSGGSSSYSVLINAGAASTVVSDVDLNSTAPIGTAKMRVSNSVDFSTSTTFDFVQSLPWDLCERAVCQPGTYQVYVKFFDYNGLPTRIYTDDIYLSEKTKEKKLRNDPSFGVALTGSIDGTVYSGSLNLNSLNQKVYLKAIISGILKAKGKNKLTYLFDCEDDGLIEYKISNTPKTTVNTGPLCSYGNTGKHFASVQVLSSDFPVGDKMLIEINDQASVESPTTEQTASTSTEPVAIVTPPASIEPTTTVIVELSPILPVITGLLAEVVSDIAKSVGNSIVSASRAPQIVTEKVVQAAPEVAEAVAQASKSPKAALGLGTFSFAPILMALQYPISHGDIAFALNSFSDAYLALLQFIQGLLTSIGLRKRRRYWGTVYDAVTKEPIDPAIVELVDALTGRVVEQCITDLYGRFGFLDRPGAYIISVRKTHYVFPSKIVLGDSDGIFEQIYHGERLYLEGKGVLAPNIPMDPLVSDWNQEEKLRKGITLNFKLHTSVLILLKLVFWIGFLLAFVFLFLTPTKLNAIIAFLYTILALFNRNLPGPHLWGYVSSLSGNRVDSLLLEMYYKEIPNIIVAKSYTNSDGKFFLKANPGRYILKIKDANHMGKLIEEKEVSVGKNSTLNSHLTII